MDFKKEIQALTEAYSSPKLLEVRRVMKRAATSGMNQIVLASHLYDDWIIQWLKEQGFQVEETRDQREGDFLTVSW